MSPATAEELVTASADRRAFTDDPGALIALPRIFPV
jgi:hypothetical protein